MEEDAIWHDSILARVVDELGDRTPHAPALKSEPLSANATLSLDDVVGCSVHGRDAAVIRQFREVIRSQLQILFLNLDVEGE